MKAQHIIQVSAYYPPHLGGQENAVYDLASQLAEGGHNVQVLTSSAGSNVRGDAVEGSVHVKRRAGLIFGHAPIMPSFPATLFRAIRTTSVIHLHIGQAFTPEMVWLIAKLRRVPYIAQLHIDFQPSGPVGILLPLYKQLVLKRVLQSAACVITLNEETKRIVRKVYGCTGRVEIMNNGLDEVYFQLKRPALAPKPPTTLHLLFVGRLTKQKNIPTLLKALKLTKRKVCIDIIGDGPELELIKKLVLQYKLENVVLRGRFGRADVMEFYKICDALIMPSLYEAQPLVLLEALAARIPIIGTNVIGVAEHIKEGGIIVEPTVEGLVEGIEQYYTQYASLPERVAKAYRSAEKLRWRHTLKNYESLYEEVLGD